MNPLETLSLVLGAGFASGLNLYATVATLGLLLLAHGPGRWALFVVPLIWCAITGATLFAMKAPDFWVAPLAAVLAGTVEVSTRVSRSSLRFQRRRT